MSNALVVCEPEAKAGDPRSEIRAGLIVAALFFVLFLGWAAFVPLDAGVHATGTIAVAGNRQTVQHRETVRGNGGAQPLNHVAFVVIVRRFE